MTDAADPGRHREVLAAAVAAIGGSSRPGQEAMSDAVAESLAQGRHLLVQAGTGTGKSLGYLAPALVWLNEHPGQRIVVATATLALQSQLAHADIPAALKAIDAVGESRPEYAVVKGRSNYACLLRVRDAETTDQGALIGAGDIAAGARSTASPESVLGAEVVGLREWAEDQASGAGYADRDDAPPHSDRAWHQVSVPARECLGAQRCPYGDVCLVERARDRARAAGLVVTNHALLAIDAMNESTALPDYQAVVIDEAHELVGRVTSAASAELSPQLVERVGKRALADLADDVALELLESAEALRTALEASPLQRVEQDSSGVVSALERVRAATRAAVTALSSGVNKPSPEQRQAAAVITDVFAVAERMAALHPDDVVWVSERERFGRELRVAPLAVADLMRDRIFGERTTILTSATLKLGGDFTATANALGLRDAERVADAAPTRDSSTPAADTLPWQGLDVGSPFDYRRQGIRYVARALPAPGRDGLGEQTLAEIAELVWAAGGRTLGLFSSRRAAEVAAVHVRRQLPKLTVLCQGDAQLSELTRRFLADEDVSLFGTLSLWQGLDVPGATCQLVIIDRIPFPRPDEPLTLARQQAVAQAGGNGFMSVAATHAALLLAQGSGRLVRRTSDRGVVAVLDPRLVTARYGSFLRASMPDMWQTTDRETVIEALRRLRR